MNSIALRSDCNKGRPILVFVVAKNVRVELRIASNSACRAGLAISQGLKPNLLSRPCGTAESRALIQSRSFCFSYKAETFAFAGYIVRLHREARPSQMHQAIIRTVQSSLAATRPVAATAEEAGQPEQVSEVVPGAVVVHFVDVEIALKQRDQEHERRDKSLPQPQPEPCDGDLLAGSAFHAVGPGNAACQHCE